MMLLLHLQLVLSTGVLALCFSCAAYAVVTVHECMNAYIICMCYETFMLFSGCTHSEKSLHTRVSDLFCSMSALPAREEFRPNSFHTMHCTWYHGYIQVMQLPVRRFGYSANPRMKMFTCHKVWPRNRKAQDELSEDHRTPRAEHVTLLVTSSLKDTISVGEPRLMLCLGVGRHSQHENRMRVDEAQIQIALTLQHLQKPCKQSTVVQTQSRQFKIPNKMLDVNLQAKIRSRKIVSENEAGLRGDKFPIRSAVCSHTSFLLL
jgi:hypothetical protein